MHAFSYISLGECFRLHYQGKRVLSYSLISSGTVLTEGDSLPPGDERDDSQHEVRGRWASAMSQRIVERIIGRLVTDEEQRLEFTRAPRGTLRLFASGVGIESCRDRCTDEYGHRPLG